MQRELSPFDHWRDATAGVEWLCHVGVGRFFAPWDARTVDEYRSHREALLDALGVMRATGVIEPGAALVARAAIAAHGAPYPRHATFADLRARDEALRRALLPPAELRARVRAEVPEGPWPLPMFIPPPPRPRWLRR